MSIKARLTWVNLYFETKDAGYICPKFGISRPTLRHDHIDATASD